MKIPDERPIWSMSGSELLSALDTDEAEVARIQTRRMRMTARLDEIGYAQELGASTTAELLAIRYRLDRRDAHREVKLARAVSRYSAVSAALPDPAGPLETPVLRPAQAQAIVSALETVPDRVPVEDIAVAEQQLVNLAQHLSPGELRKAGKEIRDLLDSDGPEPAEEKAYERESLTLADADNGVAFRGFLANENAELFRSWIHANARPHKTVDGELDPRSREKRQADALTTTLRTAAGAAESGAVPGVVAKANITVTIDLQDLKAATADAVGHVVYGDALSAATIRRLACDAKIIPLVLGSKSEPLDVGRAERLVTPAMRRALNARDKGCVICAAPPINCDAHHLQSWIDGGITAINNLALICRRHHTALHNGHWTITITNGEVQVSRPTWADPPGLLKPLPPRPSDQNPPHTDQPAEGGPNHPCLVQPTAGIERGSTRITSSESGSTWPGSTEPGSTRITSSESGSTWPGSTEPGSTEITSSELRRGG